MTPGARKKIQRELTSLAARRVEYPTVGDAGVLIPILVRRERPLVLLTKRTDSVSTHKGQVSFPGGVREPQDESLLRTALRETEEELGIPQSSIEVLGCFHEYLSVTELRVVPFVGYLEEVPNIRPNPLEVEKVLEVPVDFFQQTEPRVEERRKFGRVFPVYYYDFGSELIWGLTAAILRDFVEFLELTS